MEVRIDLTKYTSNEDGKRVLLDVHQHNNGDIDRILYIEDVSIELNEEQLILLIEEINIFQKDD